MNRNLIIISIIALILISGCNAAEQNELHEVFKEIDVSKVPSISVRTQMSKDYPEEKVLMDSEDIELIINYLRGLEGEKVGSLDSNGWQFWIQFEGYNILFIDNKIVVNNEEFTTIESVASSFKKIYEQIEVQAQKYP